MEDRTVLNCEEIKKRLKPFLEDLLAEDEYQAYVCHLNTCAKCKDYVGRFGSLSNQLRELGNIKVPSDFCSTVCFNISEPVAEKPQTPKENRTKNLIAGAVILAVISAGIFAGVIYFKKYGSSRKTDGSPVITARTITEKSTPSDRESEALLNELQSIATSLGVPNKKEGVEKSAEQISAVSEEPSPLPGKTSGQKIVSVPTVKLLHWHFLYAEDSEKTGLLNALTALGIQLQKQTSSLLVFNATGEKLDDLLKKIISGSKRESPLSNFTSEQATPPDKESRVSLYFQNEKPTLSGDLHWHIKLFQISRSRFTDIILKGGGSVDYESGGLLIISFPKNEVKNLYKQLGIMGAFVDVYGKGAAKENLLDSSPTIISIFLPEK